MLKHTRYTRRSFLGGVSGASAAAAFSPYLAWMPAHARPSGARTRFALIASWQPQRQGIHVFAADTIPWTPVQFVPSKAPSAFAVSADQRTLFVTNCVLRFQGLPTASVESYRIDPSSGRFTLISRVPLALSAVQPGHLALSPDGAFLAVAVTGGGSYNLLPVAADGSLGPVSILRKEIGSGPHPSLQTRARPGQLTFDAQGNLLTTDLGADQVSSFRPDSGTLQVLSRHAARPGSGPASLALDRDAGLVFVGNALDGTIRTHRYQAATATLGEGSVVNASSEPSSRLAALTLHPSGRLLVSASNLASGGSGLITAWQINPGTSNLLQSDTATLESGVAALAATPNGQSLVTLEASGSATLLDLDARSGRFGSRTVVASVLRPQAIALTGR